MTVEGLVSFLAGRECPVFRPALMLYINKGLLDKATLFASDFDDGRFHLGATDTKHLWHDHRFLVTLMHTPHSS